MKNYMQYDKPIQVFVRDLDGQGIYFEGKALGKIVYPHEKPNKIHIEILVEKEDGSGVVCNARYVHPI